MEQNINLKKVSKEEIIRVIKLHKKGKAAVPDSIEADDIPRSDVPTDHDLWSPSRGTY